MKTKNKTAGARESSGGQKYINKKLSVVKYNTPVQIGQFNFSTKTEIFTKPRADRYGRSRCYGCLSWVKTLGGIGLSFRPGTTTIQYGVCRKCIDSLVILPPNLQRKFAEKCEKNLKNALEGNSDV